MLKRISLVGPMGAGKSTIGRLLSRKLHLVFIDSDRLIEERSGAAVSWIFDVEGEQGFRDREQSIIRQVCEEQPAFVLATGGGSVLREENRQELAMHTTVIYLYASIEQQLARTAKDRSRPLLQVKEPEKVLQQLMQERDPLYRAVADFVIKTDERHPRFLVQDIIDLLPS